MEGPVASAVKTFIDLLVQMQAHVQSCDRVQIKPGPMLVTPPIALSFVSFLTKKVGRKMKDIEIVHLEI